MNGSSAGGEQDARLSLLVTRDAHAVQVFELAETARRKGIALTVHLTGRGVLLCQQKGFARLRRICRVMVCRESAGNLGLLDPLQMRYPDLMYFCAEVTGSFLDSRQRLVF